jgi:phosphoglycerate dehydrogenase-like enzyme
MPDLKISCSTLLNDDFLKMVREGVAPHEVILPEKMGDSFFEPPSENASLVQADVVFGQPSAESVLAATKLRWLHVTSAGYTRYDTPEFQAAAKARGLIVTNSSAVFAESCAEHVFSYMLAQARQLPLALRTRYGTSSPEMMRLRAISSCLKNQSVVILGYGTIAARLVELLAPFQMKIVAMRRHPRGDEPVPTVAPDDLQTALATADHVVNILPDNAVSRRFVSAERLGWMKPGAVFYNIGRGTTVDQDALAAQLESGRLEAAWLDVTDPEPLPENHPLLKSPRCFITPHSAGSFENTTEALMLHFLDNFGRFLKGEALLDRVM